MRFLHVVSDMDPKSGGVSQAVRMIISGLDSLNVVSDVVSTDNPDADFMKHNSFQLKGTGPAKSSWKFTSKLGDWLSSNITEYDVIIVHGIWQYPSFITYKIWSGLKYKKPKLFVMPHGMLDPWFQKSKERKLKAIRNWFYWKLIERKIINNADSLLFTCEEERILAYQTFNPYCPKSDHVVGLGIERPPVVIRKNSTDVKTLISENIKREYLLFLSRIDPKKGVDILISAYKQVKLEIPNLPQLVIAGPGLETKYGETIRGLASGDADIIFTGMLSGDKKWLAFYESEALILPSHQENFGIAVVEALACKRQVLITNKVNIWQEIIKNQAGFVCNDTIEGVKGMLFEFSKQTKQERMLKEAYAFRTFEENYTTISAANKILDLVKQQSLIV